MKFGIARLGATLAMFASLGSPVSALIKSHGAAPLSSLLKARIRGIGGEGDAYYGQVFDWKTAAGAESWLCLYDKQAHKVTLGAFETVTAVIPHPSAFSA